MFVPRFSILALALSCTGSASDDAVDPGSVTLDGECAMDVDQGGFIVQRGADGAGIEGKVADGVVPISVLEPIGAEGDCVLLRRNNPYCDPACDRGQTCDFDGQCLPYPANQDLGTVAVAGLDQDLAMEPVFPGNTYFDTSLADPPFEPGSVITLDVPQGPIGAATLHGIGVESVSGLAPEWVVREGQDLTVAWAAPTAGALSQVAVRISIDQHGASPGVLRCLFDDDGEGTVPAGLIDQLISSGVTGFPTGTLVRQTADHVQVDGACMDLVVAHPVGVPVDVDGFTPCLTTQDCPDDLECNIELQICE